MMKYSAGFSLVESIVIVSMIAVLTTMSLSAFPAVRAHQELVTDTELIRSLLLDAKQRTINEVRDERCLEELRQKNIEDKYHYLCADTGIALYDGKLVQYANTVDVGPGAKSYDAVDIQGSGNGAGGLRLRQNPGPFDFVNSEQKLATTIKSGSAFSLLFAGVPPSAVLYNDGVAITGHNYATITLVASDGTERTIRVYSLGTIEVL